MSRYRHIAFDFDGVVANSAAVCADEINYLRIQFPSLPKVAGQWDFVYLYPGPLRTSLRRFGLDQNQIELFFDMHSGRMLRRADELRAFDGVAAYSESVRNILNRHLDSVQVNNIDIMGRELRMKKSDKINTIIKNRKIDKKQILKVGDMVSDIHYSNEAGIDCAAVGWGYHPIEYLRAFDAQYFLSKPEELSQFVAANLE